MRMKLSTDRILTTHVGSLPRPRALLDLLRLKLTGEPVDQAALDARIAQAVDDIVHQQVEVGIDLIDDGEQSKSGFANYVRDRLGGFEARPSENAPFMGENPKVKAFPEYYALLQDAPG
jgi:5-methyltetrahydropteroyltriglutamate--homocysteine methyltransferase